MRTTWLNLTLLLLLVSQVCLAQCPALYRATTDVNVRKCPSAYAEKIGLVGQNEEVRIEKTCMNGSTEWGAFVTSFEDTGYVCMRYMQFQYRIEEQPVKTQVEQSENSGGLMPWLRDMLKKIGGILKIVFIIGLILVVLAFKDYIAGIIGTYIIFAIIGAIIGYFFGNASLGASIACWIVTIVGGIFLVSVFGGLLVTVPLIVLMFPMYVLNQIQYFLIAPWRWFFKSDWLSEDVKDFLRPVCTFVTIVLTIADTPLRVFNSVVYNSLHFVYDFYNYVLEVIMPSSDDEGAEDALSWLIHFIGRVLKYPIFNGMRSLLDSVLFTVVDVFVPTLTMYHGTNEVAAESILADKERNTYQKWNTDYRSGTFTSSSEPQNSWGGLGVYFAKSIFVAMGYGNDPRRNHGYDPVVIVCRVSYGKIVNYNLCPYSVSSNAGEGGRHKQINSWTMSNGYDTGEWWNDTGDYWEYCLFDWQNKYNYPWRIRPIYAYNMRSLFFHRIKGGMMHWLSEEFVDRFMD